MRVCGTTACWPGWTHGEALRALVRGTAEPLLGPLDCAAVQLCPQNAGYLDEARAVALREAFPQVRLRLHANVRVSAQSRPGMGDAASCEVDSDHFRAIGRIGSLVGAQAYTLHAGKRAAGTLESARAGVLALEDRLGIAVGVEAMYPDSKQTWLLSSWEEYTWLLETDVRYALDLSHLHILSERSRCTDFGLTAALLENTRCIEIHVSGNNGRCDRHEVLRRRPWWWPCLEGAVKYNPGAIVFSEGNQLMGKPKR